MREVKKKNNIAPTLTLAKLYESQNQYFNALQIYEQLEEIGEPGMMQDNIGRVNEMIFRDSETVYQELTKKLFSMEELRKFRFIPADMYLSFQRSMVSESDEFEHELDEEIEEEDYVDEPEVKDEQITDINENIKESIIKELTKNQTDSVKTENHRLPNSKQILISDLSGILLEISKTDKPIGDVTFSEIMRFLRKLSEE